jgi:iron complex outermembrane recepter protein
LSGGFAYYDATLQEDYCGYTDLGGNPITNCPPGSVIPSTGEINDEGPQAFAGARLPVIPEFKGNVTARYTWDFGGYEAHVQGAVFHQGDRTTDLRIAESGLLGDLDAYTTLDLSAGVRRGAWQLDFFLKNATDEVTELAKFAECATLVCGNQPYTVSTPPRTFGVRWSRDF